MVTFTRGETVTRQRQKRIPDPYNPDVTIPGGWDDPDEAQIPNVAIAPTASTVAPDATREQIDSAGTLYAAVGVDIRHGDRLVAFSGVWDVEGEVLPWRNPYDGSTPGVEARLSRVTG